MSYSYSYDGGYDGRGSGNGWLRASAGQPYILRFLAPDGLAAALIGKGGSVIAGIRDRCQAKLSLTEYGDTYPNTGCRILAVSAKTIESLDSVIKELLVKVDEVAKEQPSGGCGCEGDLKMRALGPRAAMGAMIGKNGATITHLRESTGAKIAVADSSDYGPGAEQMVTVQGTNEALETVLTTMNHKIQALCQETWYKAWAEGTGGSNSYGYYSAGYDDWSGAVGSAPIAGMSSGNNSSGVDLMVRVAQGLPPYVMEESRGFALACVVPNRLVGGLIGRGGTGTKNVQMMTGTKIGIRKIPGDSENRSLNINGPLANVCAAYMMMMKRYLDVEAESSDASAGHQ